MSKRLGSSYRSGRVDHWLKIKNPAQAINSDDADRAARIIRDALGIESDDVVNSEGLAGRS